MRILIIEPRLAHHGRGNLTTTRRWKQALKARGVFVACVVSEDLEGLGDGPFDLVHAHHAGRAGPAGLRFARSHGLPLIVSAGGTDIRGPRAFTPQVREVLSRADLVLAPFASDERLLEASLGATVPFATVPRGIPVGRPPSSSETMRADRWLFSGGLRDVKDPLFAVRTAQAARRAGFDVALDVYGPAIDEALRGNLEIAIANTPHRYHGEAAPESMANVYDSHDLLLNTSLAEGASNSILEAWRSGLVVLARRVPGNVEMLADAPPDIAFLFDENDLIEEPMRRWFEGVVRDRRVHARRAWEYVRDHHSVDREVEALLEAYRRALLDQG